jgi:hypothetical protein
VLGNPKADGQQAVNQAHTCTEDGSKGYAPPQSGSLIDHQPTGHGPQGHDPFDAQIENAGPLTEDFAQSAKEQGSGNAQGGHPKAGGAD